MTLPKSIALAVAILLPLALPFSNAYVSSASLARGCKSWDTRLFMSQPGEEPNPQDPDESNVDNAEEEEFKRYVTPEEARAMKAAETMMGDDWRVFRARLVAREMVEESALRHRASAPSQGRNKGDEKQARQAQIGQLFEKAMSSVFKSRAGKENKQEGSIFDGVAIGGANNHANSFDSDIEDPFHTEDEIPVLMKPKSVEINRHRWAHSIPHIEPGCLLVANEKLGGVFHQTVVLITKHSDTKGTTGYVINRPLEGNLLKVATENPDSTLALSTKMAFNSARVSFGGPVNQAEYEVLHSYGEVNGAETVAPGVFIGGCDELMQEVRRNNMSPNKALFCKGHAAWVPGQLEREISKGVWYICAASSDLILRYAGAPIEQGDIKDDLWSDVLTCMGGEYVHIAGKYASPGGDIRLKP